MIRQRGITVREQLRPSTPAERRVYTAAEITESGAWIVLFGEREPRLHLPNSQHAAALESLARALRLALEREEQRALSQDGTPGVAVGREGGR